MRFLKGKTFRDPQFEPSGHFVEPIFLRGRLYFHLQIFFFACGEYHSSCMNMMVVLGRRIIVLGSGQSYWIEGWLYWVVSGRIGPKDGCIGS